MVERVETSTLDRGPGPLRAAIEAANVTPGPDVITFNIASERPKRAARMSKSFRFTLPL